MSRLFDPEIEDCICLVGAARLEVFRLPDEWNQPDGSLLLHTEPVGHYGSCPSRHEGMRHRWGHVKRHRNKGGLEARPNLEVES